MGRAQLFTCDQCREAHRVDHRGPLGTLAVGDDIPQGWAQLALDRRPRAADAFTPAAGILEVAFDRVARLEAGERIRMQCRPQKPFRVRRVLEQVPGGTQLVTYDPGALPFPARSFMCTRFIVGTENALATEEPLPLTALALADVAAVPAMPGVNITLELEALERVDVANRALWCVGDTTPDVDPFDVPARMRGALLCPRCSSSLQLVIDGKPLELVDVADVGGTILGEDLAGDSIHRRPFYARRVR